MHAERLLPLRMIERAPTAICLPAYALLFSPSHRRIMFLKQVLFPTDSSSSQHAVPFTSFRHLSRYSLRVQRRDSSRHPMEHHAFLRARRAVARDNGPSRQR